MELRKYLFSDFVSVNPLVSLKPNKDYSFIEMKDLSDGQRFAYPSRERKLTGGARFEEGDTLFARITPCLENGKICQAKNLKNGKAFGSTEFLIFREKEGVSNRDFVYYLSRWDKVRRFAEANLVGTSGRQRVSKDVFEKLELELPDLPTQSRIGSILSSLDDKIELNRRMNQTLEQMAQALFNHFFVDNIDPDNLPKGWKLQPLYDFATYINGAAFKEKDFSSRISSLPIVKIVELKYGISNQTKWTNKDFDIKYRLETGDILFSWSGSPETSIDTFLWVQGSGWLNQHIFKIETKSRSERAFVFLLLKYFKPIFIEIAKNKQTTGLGHVTIADLKRIHFFKASDSYLNKFTDLIIPIIDKIESSLIETEKLVAVREFLLPKLMSGEIDVNALIKEESVI